MSLLDDLGGRRRRSILRPRPRRRRRRLRLRSTSSTSAPPAASPARCVADRSDADDVVAEVFAAAFAAMRKGLGPADDFRSYVLTSVRRECQRTWRTGARQRPGGDVVVDLAAARAAPRDEFEWFDEDEVVHRAFASLARACSTSCG